MITLLNLSANWPAPDNVKTVITTRNPGQSQFPFDQNNLALHVGDNPKNVLANRRQLIKTYHLPNEPIWLNQTHSKVCILADKENTREADAAISRSPNQVLAIMTADCLPIMLCNQQGTEIAAIHAGWRGLVNGVINSTLAKMDSPPKELMAWIGTSICQQCYEVGDEVKNTILEQCYFAESAFKTSPASAQNTPKWLANLPLLAEMILNQLQISSVYQSNLCTFEQREKFYSYRRAAQTGRIATLIWFS